MKAIILVLGAIVIAFLVGCLPDGSNANAATAASATPAAAQTSTVQQQLLDQQKTILALQEQMKKNAAALSRTKRNPRAAMALKLIEPLDLGHRGPEHVAEQVAKAA